jgi:hypothetical protein
MSENNEHVADLVDDYLHALLLPRRAAAVEEHCNACPACQTALEDARRRRALLQAVPPSEPSNQLLGDTLRRINGYDQQRRRRLRRFFLGSLTALAACALVLSGAQIHYNNLTATPYDLMVLGQHQLLAGANGSLRIRLLDHARNLALAGIPIVIELKGNGRSAELARFDTDALGVGQPRFRLPDWPDGDYGLVVTAQTPGSPETISRSVRLMRSWKLMLTSDKPVYQPGQTIHVRALALRQPDLRPVAEQETSFTLADPKGNVLFKNSGRTSHYGIAATDCQLAKEIAEGAYTLACKIGDSESRLRLEVRKYVLPKFKVDVQVDRSFYQPGDKAHITVRADYFFGKPVADATVELEIRETSQVLQTFSLHTDAAGAVGVAYTIPNDLGKRSDKQLSFTANVTDSAGQKQSVGVDRLVTRQPVRIEVLPENGVLVQDVSNIVYLLATHADGTPARARLTIEGPNEVVDTDANGLASFEVTPGSGGVNWTIVARDAANKEIARRSVNLSCDLGPRDFLLRTDRAFYESGQTMRLSADGQGNEPIFVDILKGEQTLLSETIGMNDGHGVCAIDLPPDLFGTVRLCAYRLDAYGVRLSKTRVLYIHPAGQLKIVSKLDQKEYRPGRRAHLDLTLTDSAGKPCPGAISLAGVDEAVFSVLSQRPGSEETFYTLEPQLLQPVYALYPWSPQRKGADDKRLEQALFAATVRSGTENTATDLHSLTATTFPEKTQEVTQARLKAEDRILAGWIVLGLALLGLGYASLWCFLRPETVLALHALPFFVIGMLLLFLLLLALTGCGASHTAPAPARLAKEALGTFGVENNPIHGLPHQDVFQPAPVDPAKPSGEPAMPHVRKNFPETFLWKPQLITDDEGRAHLDIDLADSITTWRISTSAVAADGRLGATQFPVKVFQPFFVDLNLPVSLTRNDEMSVPVVVYNYLDKPQTVTLKLAHARWFSLQGNAEQQLDLAPHEVRSTVYRIRATKAGIHELQVSAFASGIADALKRSIEVEPDGRRVEQVFNGSLQQPGGVTLLVPDNAIDGSIQAFLKIYPSGFSQLVEGLDNIFQMPYGCFEQTSSTTYPNILALDYLKRTGRSIPKIEAKARQYIHLGYQRLVSFEVAGGGFDWFGHPPANRTLTAYGLMEFEDMARVHDVDPQLIARTRRWLLSQRLGDGWWAPEGHQMHDAPTGQGRLATTAYIAWAVFGHNKSEANPAPTRDFLLKHTADSIRDPHVVALMANALLALDSQGQSVAPYLDRLEALKHTREDGKQTWWQQPNGARTTFYGSGRSGSIETTALATLALLQGRRHPGTTRSALAWLIAQKDARGTWHSTQATVLTLKALLAAADGGPGDSERRILARLGDKFQEEIVIPADQSEVLKQVDLSELLTTGRQRLELSEKTTTGAGYQVTFRYHVPEMKREDRGEPLRVRLDYERTELRIGETTKATAKVFNNRKDKAAMVMLELPVPAGFTVADEDFATLAKDGRIARVQLQGDKVLLYLRELAGNAPLELSYHLRATMAVNIQSPGAHVYEYYDPEREGRSAGARLTVTARR